MAINQDTYLDSLAFAYPGMVANGETSNRPSRTIEDAAGIAFGKAVFRGAGDHGVTGTPAAGVGKFLGITGAHETLGLLSGGTADVYPQYSTPFIMAMGVIWITAGAAVAAGDQVYVTSAGAFTNVSTSNTILTGWFFDDTVASGSLARIARR